MLKTHNGHELTLIEIEDHLNFIKIMYSFWTWKFSFAMNVQLTPYVKKDNPWGVLCTNYAAFKHQQAVS